MITPSYVHTLARYNAWQNESLIAAADTLDAAARTAERGAFFGTIEATFNHLLWADRIWMHRLAGLPRPNARSIAESVQETPDWPAFVAARRSMDAEIETWAAALGEADVAGELTWFSGSAGRELSKPLGLIVAHLFNHQTHHRGQLHAMLTAAGATTGDTDLALMP